MEAVARALMMAGYSNLVVATALERCRLAPNSRCSWQLYLHQVFARAGYGATREKHPISTGPA